MSSGRVDFSWAAAGILLAVAAAVIVVTFAVTLVVARAVGQHSVVDVTWGLGFVLVAIAAYVVSGALGVGNDVVRLVALALPVIWGAAARDLHRRGATTARARTRATPRCWATTTHRAR